MISIIVPIYNVAKYLNECLRSIQVQDYTDFEVLCVDDGSKDNSVEIALKFVEVDKRYKLYRQPNSGVSVARNTGIKYAQGDYICFVDADDMVAPNYLSVLYNFSNEGNFSICGFTKNKDQLGKGKDKIFRCSAKEMVNKVLDESVEHPNIWAMMFKAEVIKFNNIEFCPGCVRNEDTEFYMKYLVHEKGDVVVVKYKGYYYRDNPSSAMHVTKREAFTSFEASERIERYLADNGMKLAYNKMLYGSIQAYSVGLARENNLELYEELHNLYNVRKVMCTLTKHPRLFRRVMAGIYIVLGKNVYYKMLSLVPKR